MPNDNDNFAAKCFAVVVCAITGYGIMLVVKAFVDAILLGE